MTTPQRQIGYLFDSIFDRQSSILNRAVQWNMFLKEGHRTSSDSFDAIRFDNNIRHSLRGRFIDEFDNLSGQQTSQQFRSDITGVSPTDLLGTNLGESIAEEISFRQLQFGRGSVTRNLTEGFFDDNSTLSRSDQAQNLFRTFYDDEGGILDRTKPLSDRMEDVVKKLDSGEANPSELGAYRIFAEVKNDRLDADATMERINFEFDRFMADQGEQSLLNKYSSSGRAYVRARQQLKNTLVVESKKNSPTFNRSKAVMENNLARGIVKDSDGAIVGVDRAQYISSQTGEGALFVNKPGVLPFMSAFESAQNRIDIDIFQLQNKTVMSYLMDVIQRKGRLNPNFEVNVRVAYPRNFRPDDPTIPASIKEQAARDKTTYAILGPNLIEIQKLAELNSELIREVGNRRNGRPVINIELQDRKYHPKLIYTDEVALIGSANLTNPIGSSINQAGANFEQMLVVRNKFADDLDLTNGLRSRYNSRHSVSDAEKRSGVSSDENLNFIQTLLHRQLTQFVDRSPDQRNALFSTAALQERRGQFGVAGDIQEHLQSTLDTLEGLSGANNRVFRNRNIGVTESKVKNSRGVAMFMILDQSFILNYAKGVGLEKGKVSPILPNQSAGGEMGPESDVALKAFMTTDRQTKWRKLQRQVLTGLARNLIVTTVDTKNYRTTVFDPLVKLIESDTQMRQAYQEHGMDFRRLAASSLYDGGDEGALKAQHQRLAALGFTDESVRLQIMAMASGNIRMAGAPKSHTKSFGLFEFDRSLTSGAIIEESIKAHSYYLGSSNLGQFSLAFRGDENIPGRQSLVNTEYGFMVSSKIVKAALQHRRRTGLGIKRFGDKILQGNYESSDAKLANEAADQIYRLSQTKEYSTQKDYSLTTEQEWAMAQVSMRQMIHTWSQLGNNQIYNNNFLQPTLKPLWESDVDVNDLGVLKTRLEKMSKIADLGSSFDIYMKQGAQSESYKTLQVNIDLAKVLGESSNYGDISGDALGLRRVSFEMTVLNSNRPGEGNVLFLKQNKLISNSIFHNNTQRSISMMFGDPNDDRKTNMYNSINYESRNTPWMLKSGHAARLSSIDTTVYLLGTLIHESVAKGLKTLTDVFETANETQRRAFYEDYVTYLMTGSKEQFSYDEMGEVTGRTNARQFLTEGKTINRANGTQQVIGAATHHDLQILKEQLETRFAVRGNKGLTGIQRARLLNPKQHSVTGQIVNTMGGGADDLKLRQIGDVVRAVENLQMIGAGNLNARNAVLDGEFFRAMDALAKDSPEIVLDIMTKQNNPLVKAQVQSQLRDFQSLLFEPFGRFDEIQKYGGNQISSKTLILGLNPGDEEAAKRLTTEFTEGDPSLSKIRGFNRLIGSTHHATTKFGMGSIYFRGIADASLNSANYNVETDYDGAGIQSRGFTQAYSTELFSSLGIGTVTNREDIIKFVRDQLALSSEGQLIDVERIARNLERQYSSDRNYLTFYTGTAKKIAQLPQRIKNAAGARPLMSITVDAQKIYDRAAGISVDANEENFKYLFNRYLYDVNDKDRQKMGFRRRVEKILDERRLGLEDLKRQYDISGNENLGKQIRRFETSLDDAYRFYFDDSYTVGAIFGGTIKKVVNSDQAAFIEKQRTSISEALGLVNEDWHKTAEDLKNNKELEEKRRVGEELLRVIVLKASLGNSGLGNMIAGTRRNGGHSIALIQLGGLYIDTFYANPDFGTVGKQGSGVIGLREGYMQEMMTGIKAGMVGNGGINSLVEDGDMIAYDPQLRKYVHTRNGMPAHEQAYVTPNKTIQAYENVVENDIWTRYGRDGSLGTTQKSVFTRIGEFSVEHIYRTGMMQGGSFEKNEMYYMSRVVRSIMAGAGRRVEGSPSGALVKGVASFIGGKESFALGQEANAQGEPIKYQLVDRTGSKEITKELTYWEYLAEQVNIKYKTGQIGGSMAAQIGQMEGGRLSHRMISGLYNPNNFKSFLWSHGSVVMRDAAKLNSLFQENLGNQYRKTVGEGGPDNFANAALNKKTLARRLAASLVIGFGTGWIFEDGFNAKIYAGSEKGIDKGMAQNLINAGLVTMATSGELGKHYQYAAAAAAMLTTDTTKEGRYRDVANMLGRVDDESLSMSMLSGLDSTRLLKVITGTAQNSDYAEFITELKSFTYAMSGRARNKEYINIDDPMQRTAAAVVSTMDFMHQVADDADMFTLPTDFDWTSQKNRSKLLNVLGVSDAYDPERQQDYIQMLIGMSQRTSVIMANLDINFSLSKDPTGAQKVGRHEFQHLVKPMMGDINAFKEHGDIAAVGKVLAIFHGALSEKSALHYVTNTHLQPKVVNIFDSNLFSSEFFKRQFVGFYFSYEGDGEVKTLIKRYKELTAITRKDDQGKNVRGDYLEKLFQLKDAKDRTDLTKAQKGIFKTRSEIAAIESRLAMIHSQYQADPTKNFGVDNARSFLSSMEATSGNKRFAFQMPGIEISEDTTGRYVARQNRNKSFYVYMPSASDIKTMGMQWGDFVDDMISNYKNVIMGFAPGTMLNNALEKLVANGTYGVAVTSDEAQALINFQTSASEMLKTLAETSVGVKAQTIMGGKTKHQGFVATGIGSWLVPSSGILLPKAKLEEAGLISDPSRNLRVGALNATQDFIDKLYLGDTGSDGSGLSSRGAITNARLERDLAKQQFKTERALRKHVAPITDSVNDFGNKFRDFIANKAVDAKTRTAVGTQIFELALAHYNVNNKQGFTYHSKQTKSGKLQFIQQDLNGVTKVIDRSEVFKTGLNVAFNLYKSSAKDLKRTLGLTSHKLQVYNTEIMSLLDSQRRATVEGLSAGQIAEYKHAKEMSFMFEGEVQKLQAKATVSSASRKDYTEGFTRLAHSLQIHIKDLKTKRKQFHTKQSDTYVTELQLRDAEYQYSKLMVKDSELRSSYYNEASKEFAIEMHKARISAYTETFGSKDGRHHALAIEGMSGLRSFGVVKHKNGTASGLSIYSFEGHIAGNVKQDRVSYAMNVLDQLSTGKTGRAGLAKSAPVSMKAQRDFVMEAIADKVKVFEHYDTQVRRLAEDIDTDVQSKTFGADAGEYKTYGDVKGQVIELGSKSKTKTIYRDIYDGTPLGIAQAGSTAPANLEKMRSEHKILYKSGVERSRTIQNELNVLKGQVAGATSTQQLQVILSRAENLIATNDFRNLETGETFRSPPFGGTDPRMIGGFRYIQDINAVNELSYSLMRSLVDSEEYAAPGQRQTQLVSYNAFRGETAMMASPVGRITANLGDWDGDPYTNIMQDMVGDADEIQMLKNKRDQYITHNRRKIMHIRSNLSSSKYDAKQKAAFRTHIERLESANQNKTQEINQKIQTLGNQLDQLRGDVTHMLQGRMRKQLAAYMGVNEEYFKYLINPNVDGLMSPKNSNAAMDAESLYSFLEFGRSLFGGLEKKGERFQVLYHTVDSLFSMTKDVDNFMSEFNRVTGRNNPNDAANELMKIAQGVTARADFDDMATPQVRKMLQFLSIDENAESGDAAVLFRQQMIGSFQEAKNQMEVQRAITAERLGDKEYQLSNDESRRLMGRFIGSELYGRLTSTEELSGLMSKASGMTMEDITFDTLVKTLGKAGGEVLGKAYNTLVGTLYADSPVLALHGAINRMSEERQAQLEDSISAKYATKTAQEQREIITSLVGSSQSAQGVNSGGLTVGRAFRVALDQSNDFSVGLQAYLKNINQLLRDSIKFKSGSDMISQLTSMAKDFNQSNGEVEGRDEKIRQMAYHLGPGKGIIGLIRLQGLVTNEKVSLERLRSEFGVDASVDNGGQGPSRQLERAFFKEVTNRISSRAFDRGDKSYLDSEEVHKLITNLDRQDSGVFGDSKIYRQVAKYQTSQDMIRMVSSFRFEKALDAGQRYSDQIWGHARLTHYENMLGKAKNKGLLSMAADVGQRLMEITMTQSEKRQARLADEFYSEELTRIYGIHDTELSSKSEHAEAREALAEYLFKENARKEMYELGESGELRLTQRYKDAVQDLTAGDDRRAKLALFDEVYTTTRKQTVGWLGDYGQGLDRLTTMDRFRKSVGNILFAGQQRADGSAISGDDLNTALSAMKDTPDELILTLSQLVSQGKLEKQGAVIYSQMMKGALESLAGEMNMTLGDFEQRGQKAKNNSMKILKAMLVGSLRNRSGRIDPTRTITEGTRESALSNIVEGLLTPNEEGLDGIKVMTDEYEVMPKSDFDQLEADGKATRDRSKYTKDLMLSVSKEEYLASLSEEQKILFHKRMRSAAESGDDPRYAFVKKQRTQTFMEFTDDALFHTGPGTQARSIQEQAKIMGTYLNETQGDDVTGYAKALLGLTGNEAQENLDVIKSNIYQGMHARRMDEAYRRDYYMRYNQQVTRQQAFRRGSMTERLSKQAVRTLNDNRKLNTLEALVPIALTLVGSALTHAREQEDGTFQERFIGDAQTMIGSTIMALGYSRAGATPLTGQQLFKGVAKAGRTIGWGAAIGGTYKLKTSLYQSGGDYAQAVGQTLAREFVATGVNATVSPVLQKFIGNAMGLKGTGPSSALHFDKFQATKQASSSIIGAITSAFVSNIAANVVTAGMRGNLMSSAKMEVWDNALSTVSETIISAEHERVNISENTYIETEGGEVPIDADIEIKQSYYNQNSLEVAEAIAGEPLNFDSHLNPGSSSIDGETSIAMLESQRFAAGLRV